METEAKVERSVVAALRDQKPVKDLPGVSIKDVRVQPKQPFDVSFELRSGAARVQVLAEVKAAVSPRSLEQIVPWIRRLKSLRDDVSIAVIAPALSPQSQSYCIQNGIDFVDLAGNIFINVPGKLTLQRSGMRAPGPRPTDSETRRTINVFSGRSSRILRVLLENPKQWTISEISRELSEESSRFSKRFPGAQIDFNISLGSVSKAVSSLEEQLWIRRRGMTVLVPEPQRLLEQWAQKYKERYRWRLRSSFQTANPFGADATSINRGLEPLLSGPYALTGAIAVESEAPFVDVDIVDVFLMPDEKSSQLRELRAQPRAVSLKGGMPALRFIYPYDVGVFMYSRKIDGVPIVAPVQAYLDLSARGGRDLKQAEYLLANNIQPRWSAA
jgi:hypothetical protein